MSTVLPNMGLKQPTQGAAGAGDWDDDWDDNAEAIDDHNHTSGRGVRVPTAGIDINADLTFSSLYAPTNLHRITFASIVALTSNNKSLFVSSADNELYWRSNAGTNVKITSGSSLNVAAFTGGIGGDYAAVGAAVAYDDAADRYTFKQQSPGNWARLACGPVRIFEFNTSESVYVEHAVAAGLASSYTATWPAALPVATKPLFIDSAGAITYGHGDRTRVYLGAEFLVQAGTATLTTDGFITTTAAATLICPLSFIQGEQIKSIHITMSGDGAVDVTDLHVQSVPATTGSSSIGSTTVSNVGAAAHTDLDVTDTFCSSAGSNNTFVVVVVANAANLVVRSLRVVYDLPL